MAEDFKLGTDPECVAVIKRTGRIRNPNEIIEEPDSAHHEGRTGAIGVDGSRPTSSIEFRPGTGRSGEDLVNRLGDLIVQLRAHYHPRGIAYKSGAWVDPEPLGGHIHYSWGEDKRLTFSDQLWHMAEVIEGLSAQSGFLTPHLFNGEELKKRQRYAEAHNRKDFGYPRSIRPVSMEEGVENRHFEYRCPPSWLNCPETAYCYLGGAELIVREVRSKNVGTPTDWPRFVDAMYKEGLRPPGGPPLSDAFRIAVRHKKPDDFTDNWVEVL